MNLLQTRQYGTAGPWVILVHGGPGAAGYMAAVAPKLAEQFRVLEPFQRRSRDDAPATVTQHINDLHDVMQFYCGGERPVLVGHSWGAMLSLAYAAEHNESVAGLVLIGCGTFDAASRAKMQAIREQRMTDVRCRQLAALESQYDDPDERFAVMGGLYSKLDSVELLPAEAKLEQCDARGHAETWDDFLRLQESGVYPATFANIHCPAVMLHGDDDPHPGEMIYDSLTPYLPQLDYQSWPNCGHYPWREKACREDFFAALHKWLAVILA